MKSYYYHDGQTKKGPYSPIELKSRNLNKETLVKEEDSDSWKTIIEIPDLFNFIFNDQKIYDQDVSLIEKSLEPKSSIIKPTGKVKKIPIIVFLITGIALSFLFSFFIISSQISGSEKDMKEKINNLFNGKPEIVRDNEIFGYDKTKKDSVFFEEKNDIIYVKAGTQYREIYYIRN